MYNHKVILTVTFFLRITNFIVTDKEEEDEEAEEDDEESEDG